MGINIKNRKYASPSDNVDVERFPGAVISITGARCERIMSDVWDDVFYVFVWDDEKGIAYNVSIWEGDTFTVDATPETLAKYAAYRAREEARIAEECRLAAIEAAAVEARRITKGKRVRVVRGRKIAKGLEGIVFWVGQPQSFSRWGAAVIKIGVAVSNERDDRGYYKESFFVNAANCEVVLP